ncbi:hypothetical protein BC831DRAFT_541264, partial [Entophlyctis helioformis]
SANRASPSEAAEARVSPEGASISATASVAAAAAAAATSATSSMLASGLSSPTQGPLHHELHHEPHHWLLSLPASPSSSASLAASAAPFMLDISALPLQGSHHHHNHHNHDDDDNDDDNDDDDGRSYNHRSHAFQDRTSPCFSHQHSQPCSSSSSSSLPSSSSPLQGPLSPRDMGVLTSTPSLSNGRIDFKLLPNPILFPQHSSSHPHESLHLPVSPLLPMPAEAAPAHVSVALACRCICHAQPHAWRKRHFWRCIERQTRFRNGRAHGHAHGCGPAHGCRCGHGRGRRRGCLCQPRLMLALSHAPAIDRVFGHTLFDDDKSLLICTAWTPQPALARTRQGMHLYLSSTSLPSQRTPLRCRWIWSAADATATPSPSQTVKRLRWADLYRQKQMQVRPLAPAQPQLQARLAHQPARAESARAQQHPHLPQHPRPPKLPLHRNRQRPPWPRLAANPHANHLLLPLQRPQQPKMTVTSTSARQVQRARLVWARPRSPAVAQRHSQRARRLPRRWHWRTVQLLMLPSATTSTRRLLIVPRAMLRLAGRCVQRSLKASRSSTWTGVGTAASHSVPKRLLSAWAVGQAHTLQQARLRLQGLRVH